MEFNKNMTVFDAIKSNVKAVDIFKKHNMECALCNGCHKDTIEVAAKLNSVDLNKLLLELNNLEHEKKVAD